MSRRPPLKLVTGNQTDAKTPDTGEPSPPRDPRALTRPDWVALLLVALALVVAPLLAGSFASPTPAELQFGDGPLGTLKLIGLPLVFLLTGVALGILLWREWQRPVAIGLAPGVVAGFGLLGLWAALTLLSTRSLNLSLNALTALIAALLLGGLISRLARERNAIHALLLTVAGAGTLEACFGINEYVTAWKRHDVLHRINGTFAVPNFVGGYMLLTLPLTLALFVAAKDRMLKLLLGVGLLLQSACLLFTGSRAGVGVLVAGLGGWLVLTILSGVAKAHWRQIGLGLAVFAVGAVLASAPLRSRVDATLASGPGARSGPAQPHMEDQSHSSEFRRWTWIGTVRMGLANPLLGTGVGNFDVAYPRYAETAYTAHAHNSYLQWMGETGVPGLLCLMVGLTAVTAFAVNILLLRRRPLAEDEDEDPVETPRANAPPSALFGEPRLILCGLIAALLASLMHNFIDSDWYVVGNLVTLAGILALMVAVARDIAPLATQIPRPMGRPFFALGAALALLLVWRGIATENVHLAYASAQADYNQCAQTKEAAICSQARAGFTAITAAMPFDPEPHLKLADMATGLDDALTELKTAARLGPSGKTLYRLGQFYAIQRQWDPAIEALEHAREVDPHNTQTLRALGNADLGANKPEQAVEVFHDITALEEKPYGKVRAIPQIVDIDFAYAHAALANIAAQANRWSEAETEYAKADKVLHEYWMGRHWDINIDFFPLSKRQDIAKLYDDVYIRWQECLTRQGKTKEAEDIAARQAQYRKERDAEPTLKQTAASEGGAGA